MVHALPTMATPPFSHYLHRMHREFWAKKSLILRVGDIGWFLSYFFIIILPRHGRTILFIHCKRESQKMYYKFILVWRLKKKLFKTSFYEIKILMVQ